MNGKIWIAVANMDGKDIEYEWESIEALQKDWQSEECPCPCGDDEVLGYSINGLIQDTGCIKENEHGYRDFSALLKVLGVKDNMAV